jgi:hypothetical protein
MPSPLGNVRTTSRAGSAEASTLGVVRSVRIASQEAPCALPSLLCSGSCSEWVVEAPACTWIGAAQMWPSTTMIATPTSNQESDNDRRALMLDGKEATLLADCQGQVRRARMTHSSVQQCDHLQHRCGSPAPIGTNTPQCRLARTGGSGGIRVSRDVGFENRLRAALPCERRPMPPRVSGVLRREKAKRTARGAG